MEPAASPKALGKRRASAPLDLRLAHPAKRRSPSSLLTSRLYRAGFGGHTTALKAHYSCVNALACSSGEGRWLASGGDDTRVLLWSCFSELGDGSLPRAVYAGARSNIFSIDFNCDGTKVFSGGNDEHVFQHDLETGASSSSFTPPENVWKHDASVRRVVCHPENPHLFMSASEDGTLGSYDTRSDTNPAILAQPCEFNDVIYCPTLPHQFVSADSDGLVLLHDGRMAFSDLRKTASEVAILKYNTSLVRIHRSHDDAHYETMPHRLGMHFETSSIAFDPPGRLLVATMSKHLPTLFEISDPDPLACFSSPQEGRFGYSNLCTVKHGSFGGTSDAPYYAAGSDDFRAYIWAVPSVEALRAQRHRLVDGHYDPPPPEIAPKDPPWWIAYEPEPFPFPIEDKPVVGDPCTPATLSSPTSVLKTHRSIVNTALFHPSLPLLFTAGVEKCIHVHHSSPSAPPAHGVTEFPERTPKPGLPNLFAMVEDTVEEDKETLEYFDHLLDRDRRRYSGVRLWEEESDSEEESGSEESEPEEEDREDMGSWGSGDDDDDDDDAFVSLFAGDGGSGRAEEQDA